jgi:hypothetical protein
MSAELLQRLKVKNAPAPKLKVTINIPVEIKTKIKDQRKVGKVNRKEFMMGIKTKIGRVSSVPDKPKRSISSSKAKHSLALPPELIMEIIGRREKKLILEPEGAAEPKAVNRKTARPADIVLEGTVPEMRIGDEILRNRVGEKPEEFRVRASSYYMNNRKIFMNFMSGIFEPYKKEINENAGKASCDRGDGIEFSLMAHQKIVRDYINLYTPYRGLLLYHGLGSGKTCTSIAIAEGIKTSRPIIVMTPASLRMNYVEELKKCGDSIYKKNQFWEFIHTDGKQELIDTLSKVLSLSVEYIRRQQGAWLVNVTKQPNFGFLDATAKSSIDNQINEMIRYKYRFINYNGLRNTHLRELSKNYEKNPFDNAVVIIDEAHNFVSRIVNKLKKPESLSMRLYEYISTAENAKIVFLTGTPIINYPNELGILFNMLRGKIKTWSFKLNISDRRKINTEYFKKIFSAETGQPPIMDFIEYTPTTTTLRVTRNPYGFVNKTGSKLYQGVYIDDNGSVTDEMFIRIATEILNKNKIDIIPKSISVELYNALPDTLEGFKSYFIDDKNEVKNMNLFKRRVLGLTSYFRSAQESLMPQYVKSKNFKIIRIPMSDFQFGVYEEARVQERKLEVKNARKKKKQVEGVFEDTVSTYRIFSRAFCNYVFPRPDIKRPMPNDGENIETAILNATSSEDILDATSVEEKINDVDGKYEIDEIDAIEAEKMVDTRSYQERIDTALKELEQNKQAYLTPSALETYSPKFLNILENLKDDEHKGLHLIYSQFRTLEGIGILKLVLESNGFAQFKIKQSGKSWELDIPPENMEKPKFVLYTGTETSEEKEIVRNIFNGFWDMVPPSIAERLKEISSNNNMGEIIKIFMITASGAEGISLKNVRYVHITEPYWHPVRMQQVIGRARRICSHQDLPEDLRTVDVFLYLMTFSDEQLSDDRSVELRLKDKGKLVDRPLTSDESLYEISTIKEDVSEKLLEAVKESSFDCPLHSAPGEKNQIKCFTFGTTDSSAFSYQPSIDSEDKDTMSKINKKKIKISLKSLTIKGIKYAYNDKTKEVFDYDSYKKGNLVLAGRLEIEGKQFKFIPV